MPNEIPISKRTLGKTSLSVTPIGLGMMEFSGGGGLIGFAFPTISQEEKNATVRAGLDGGVNWFDTAELYGGGVSEGLAVEGAKGGWQAGSRCNRSDQMVAPFPYSRQYNPDHRGASPLSGWIQHWALHDPPALWFVLARG